MSERAPVVPRQQMATVRYLRQEQAFSCDCGLKDALESLEDVPADPVRGPEPVAVDAEQSDIEAMAEAVHVAYLTTCERLGWAVKPSNQVSYAELSEDSKELDRASVRAVLAALASRPSVDTRGVERLREQATKLVPMLEKEASLWDVIAAGGGARSMNETGARAVSEAMRASVRVINELAAALKDTTP